MKIMGWTAVTLALMMLLRQCLHAMGPAETTHRLSRERKSFAFPADISEEAFRAEFQKINEDDAIDGVAKAG